MYGHQGVLPRAHIHPLAMPPLPSQGGAPTSASTSTPSDSTSAAKPAPSSVPAAALLLKKNMDTLKKLPNNVLRRLYTKLHTYYKGDPGKLTLFTMFVLVLSEMPIYFFTLLDLLKLKSLWKYRLHYDQTETYG